MTDFASNPVYVGPLPAQSVEYEGEPTKVEMTAAQRANGFVPELPVAAEHLNFELNRLTAGIPTQVEGAALCNLVAQTSGTVLNLECVCWHEQTAQFVTAGQSGHLRTSPDGHIWTAQTSGVATDIYGIDSNDTTIVYVGDAGVIRTSPDGVTWTSRISGSPAILTDVIWFPAASLFIVVGTGGVILTSPDGITWTPRTSGTAVDLTGLACNDTTVVACGGDGFTTPLCTSFDGITWSFQDLGFGPASGVAWSDSIGLFAIGAFYWLYTSPDGITWTERVDQAFGPSFGPIVATNRHFFTVADHCHISSDGITWFIADTVSNTTFPADGAWNGRVVVLVGQGGTIFNTHRVSLAT